MDFLKPNFIFPNSFTAAPSFGIWLLPVLIWSFAWKGLGLWYAAKNEEKYWFVAILILNTLGILEIAYLFFFAKKRLKLDMVLKGKKIS